VLQRAFADWRAAGGAASSDFAAFRAAQGTSFERHCVYFALRAHVLAAGSGSGDWHGWPQAYRDSAAASVAGFARSHAEEVTAYAWQQWLADRQLAQAAEAARGMRIGLYRDLAVGSDAAGAETWAERDLMVEELRIGAPPDELSASGQEWGLPPPHPQRMRAQGYRGFAELLRANMRHAGALRIDHVMALERLYVIPKGLPATEGAYLSYPYADLAGILALESSRRRCVVVGEDLGTVPSGFRDRMAAANILSYRVLRFERDAHRFFGPREYPRLAIAVCSNHDLPTLRAWWEAGDLEIEHEHGVLSDEALAVARQRRSEDRRALLELLHREQLLPGWVAEPSYEELFGSVHALLGRTRAMLVLAQLDDVLRELLPVNVPSTPGYANWRRRYSTPIEGLADAPLLATVAAAFGPQRERAASA
jgi:4-alpha-glucanotransferase